MPAGRYTGRSDSDRVALRCVSTPSSSNATSASTSSRCRSRWRASDCDGLSLDELLALADVATRDLWETLRLGYTESQGHPLLRQEIAGLYEGCEPEQVLVAAPEELIFIAMNCLVRNGDHVVCTFPGYQSLYSIAESLHAEVSRWEPDEPDGWRFDPDGSPSSSGRALA